MWMRCYPFVGSVVLEGSYVKQCTIISRLLYTCFATLKLSSAHTNNICIEHRDGCALIKKKYV